MQSEIGCYASHFKCWEWLADSDHDQAIIFEDDVLVDWSAIQVLANHKLAEHGVHLLKLFSTFPVRWKIARYRLFSRHSHLIRTIGVTYGAQAYLLTRQAARILVAKYADIRAPLDWILTRYWEHGLISYSVFPYPVIEKFVPSLIGEERNIVPAVPLPDRLVYFGWRIRDKLAREYAEKCKIDHQPFRDTVNSEFPLLN